jgi:hypothetical protein
MTSREAGLLREVWWVRAAALALAVLALATGFCLFDQDDHAVAGHVTPPDLCLGMLVASSAVLPLAGLAPIGRASGMLFTPPYAVVLHTPDPPPKAQPLR